MLTVNLFAEVLTLCHIFPTRSHQATPISRQLVHVSIIATRQPDILAVKSQMATLKVPLTITYRHAGTQPPIFIAGEFSDPPWDPQEMEHIKEEDGEYTFKKQIFAPANTKVQYKFRVGLGDWWVLNENAPTAVDAGGFLNNVAEVPAVAEYVRILALVNLSRY